MHMRMHMYRIVTCTCTCTCACACHVHAHVNMWHVSFVKYMYTRSRERIDIHRLLYNLISKQPHFQLGDISFLHSSFSQTFTNSIHSPTQTPRK